MATLVCRTPNDDSHSIRRINGMSVPGIFVLFLPTDLEIRHFLHHASNADNFRGYERHESILLLAQSLPS